MTAHQTVPPPRTGNRPTEPGTPPRGLSPSRAADFKTCPLLYRFRVIDRLPEQPTLDQARGTLVHAVLERLFDLPAGHRTPTGAHQLVEPTWQDLAAERTDLAALVTGHPTKPASPTDPLTDLLASARDLLGGYFTLEDPRRLEPAHREHLVEANLASGLLLRGYIDRLDRAPNGDLRVVDYKTGAAPDQAFENRALFQLKFYALILWRGNGTLPKALRLLYLKNAERRDYTPADDDIARFERTVVALNSAIARATNTRDFRPNPSKLCGWCAHQTRCPTFDGTPPAYPEPHPLPSHP